LLPLLDATAVNAGRLPDEVSADNGFCSEANLAGLVERDVRSYVAIGRAKHPAGGKSNNGVLTVTMRQRIRQGGHRSRYRLRKHIVEPVFGQIKAARGFRQLLLRGVEKVTYEWALICTAHKLAKLTARGGMVVTPPDPPLLQSRRDVTGTHSWPMMYTSGPRFHALRVGGVGDELIHHYCRASLIIL
jgi:hypothetical protein